MGGADWAWSVGSTFAILNLFVGFFELIGAFNYHYYILGLVGVGQALGAITLIFSAISLYLLYRAEVKSYYQLDYEAYVDF